MAETATAPSNEAVSIVPSSVIWEQCHCCVCGNQNNVVRLRTMEMLQRRGVPFNLVGCSGCQHVFVNPRPTLDSIGWFYPQEYGPHQAITSVPQNPPSLAKPGPPSRNKTRFFRKIPGLKRLFQWLMESDSAVIPNPKSLDSLALEVGCGAGGFLDQLKGSGWQTQGLEPADLPAQRCRARGLDVKTGSLENALLPTNHFEAVFAWMVLEHLHAPELAMQKIANSLTANGVFTFSVPNYGCWEPRFFGRCWYGIELVHLNYFTLQDLRTMTSQAGLKIEKVVYQNNVRNLVGSVGLVLRERLLCESLGNWLIGKAGNLSMWSQLALSPFAKLLACLGQAGRITIQARKV
jgi:SAM-dependent methyltransferase